MRIDARARRGGTIRSDSDHLARPFLLAQEGCSTKRPSCARQLEYLPATSIPGSPIHIALAATSALALQRPNEGVGQQRASGGRPPTPRRAPRARCAGTVSSRRDRFSANFL